MTEVRCSSNLVYLIDVLLCRAKVAATLIISVRATGPASLSFSAEIVYVNRVCFFCTAGRWSECNCHRPVVTRGFQTGAPLCCSAAVPLSASVRFKLSLDNSAFRLTAPMQSSSSASAQLVVAPAATEHYGDPSKGSCMADEQAESINGVSSTIPLPFASSSYFEAVPNIHKCYQNGRCVKWHRLMFPPFSAH